MKSLRKMSKEEIEKFEKLKQKLFKEPSEEILCEVFKNIPEYINTDIYKLRELKEEIIKETGIDKKAYNRTFKSIFEKIDPW